MDRHSRELTESAAGRQVRCRERREFAGHSEVAMSTRRNSTRLYEAIRSLVLSARQSAARGVDLLQVYTNYEIGRRIVEQEQQGADRAGVWKRTPAGFGRTSDRRVRRMAFPELILRPCASFFLTYPDRVAPDFPNSVWTIPSFPNCPRQCLGFLRIPQLPRIVW
jgi:hypothetical protein